MKKDTELYSFQRSDELVIPAVKAVCCYHLIISKSQGRNSVIPVIDFEL